MQCEWCEAEGEDVKVTFPASGYRSGTTERNSGIYACEDHAALVHRIGPYRRQLKPTEGESPTWRKVRLAQSRGRKAVAGLAGEENAEARAHAVATWQAEERQRESKERKPKRVKRSKPRTTRKPKAKVPYKMPEPAGPVPRKAQLIRMYRQELEALGTADALAELSRRRAKREAKRAGVEIA
jgi:hypothetical protein